MTTTQANPSVVCVYTYIASILGQIVSLFTCSIG